MKKSGKSDKSLKSDKSHGDKSHGDRPLQKGDIQKNPDAHIDQDFPGYPHNPSKEKVVHPVTHTEKATANLPADQAEDDQATESKRKNEKRETLQTEEQYSDGSANAFESTEGELEEKDSSLRRKKRDADNNY